MNFLCCLRNQNAPPINKNKSRAEKLKVKKLIKGVVKRTNQTAEAKRSKRVTHANVRPHLLARFRDARGSRSVKIAKKLNYQYQARFLK